MINQETPETYLIRYWKSKQYSKRVQYTVKGHGTEKVLTEEKSKVPDADSYSWCCDWLTQGGQTLTPDYEKFLNFPIPIT